MFSCDKDSKIIELNEFVPRVKLKLTCKVQTLRVNLFNQQAVSRKRKLICLHCTNCDDFYVVPLKFVIAAQTTHSYIHVECFFFFSRRK